LTVQIEETAPVAVAPAPSRAETRSVPVAFVSYSSHGNALVVAGEFSERARAAAEALSDRLSVTLLSARECVPGAGVVSWTGRIAALDGYLGAFTVAIEGLRTERTAPLREHAEAHFDLVLDFSAQPLFAARQPPQGYFRAPANDTALAPILDEMREAVGEFEKPRYFAYRESICAHQRSEIVGCSACIDICSTRAIAPHGDHVRVDPHLCMGCGACATVCPSGAMAYQFPPVADSGDALRRSLAGKTGACVVFHSAAVSPPAARDVVAVETWNVASVGLDLLLSAIAFGASRVVLLAAPDEDREYLAALESQMAIGDTILQALGYDGRHFAVVTAADAGSFELARERLGTAATVGTAASFAVSNDKRTAIEFAVEHLARHAPRRVDAIPLPEGAPFGQVLVDRTKCTMCMSCVGACPESALMDGVDQPLLKFLERNCVQCGLCESTCPEGAIALEPRLLLTPQVREARIVNETQPFQCVSCAKPFGTRQMVETMLGRLAGHSMFTRPEALRRLQMCGDCRVVDMISSKNEVSVLTLGDQG
jgi:ferredoxin